MQTIFETNIFKTDESIIEEALVDHLFAVGKGKEKRRNPSVWHKMVENFKVGLPQRFAR